MASPSPNRNGTMLIALLTEILLGRADANECLDQDDAAMKDLDQLVALEPRCVRAYVHRGRLFQRRQQREAAVEEFNHALEIDPQCVEAYQHRGISHYSLGERQKARADFEMARSLGFQP